MAEKKTTTPDTTEEGDDVAVEGRSGLIGKIKIAVFLLVVILAEGGVAYFVLPSAEDTALMAQAMLESAAGDDIVEETLDPVDEDGEVPRIEVDLGEYGITSYQPLTNTTMRIDFHLYGTVLENDDSEFSSRFTDNEQRLRDHVLVVLRSAEEAELVDPGLGLIKRKIMERINQALGRPLLQEIIFSDFSLVEQ